MIMERRLVSIDRVGVLEEERNSGTFLHRCGENAIRVVKLELFLKFETLRY